jgi:hypothetical protein
MILVLWGHSWATKATPAVCDVCKKQKTKKKLVMRESNSNLGVGRNVPEPSRASMLFIGGFGFVLFCGLATASPTNLCVSLIALAG